MFLKTFLDLAHNGFLKSESETDLLNVNNKISLGFLDKDLNKMLLECRGRLGLPHSVEKWAHMEHWTKLEENNGTSKLADIVFVIELINKV